MILPTPPAVTAPPCNRSAIVTRQAPPDYPDSARELDLGPRSVSIRLSITADGYITGMRIVGSSGNGALDQAALRAAVNSTYAPAYRDCKAIPGSYDFKVSFDPNN